MENKEDIVDSLSLSIQTGLLAWAKEQILHSEAEEVCNFLYRGWAETLGVEVLPLIPIETIWSQREELEALVAGEGEEMQAYAKACDYIGHTLFGAGQRWW